MKNINLNRQKMITLDTASRRSSWLMGFSDITQSPEGNLAMGDLPKSITTSMSLPISSCLYNSLFNLKGNNSRNNPSSDAASDCDVEAELGELEVDPFPEKNRSDGLRISGDGIDGLECLDEAIPLCPRRVRRNDEETVETKLEFWR